MPGSDPASRGLSLVQAASRDQWAAGRRLIEEYAASLGVDLSFQNIDAELDDLQNEYGPPGGALLLARDEEDVRFVGCVAVRRFSDDACEMKRLYVSPGGRGRGLGRILAEAVIAAARRLGYRRMLLDTLPSMQEARRLYLSLGFQPVPPYRFNPVPGTSFLEVNLG